MFKPRNSGTTFYCFSPPVMVTTFAVEVIMAVYTLVRYKMNEIGRLVVAALFFLALFQLSEYFVCGGAGLSAMHWSRIGYVAITTLPPLGLHMLYVLAGEKRRRLVAAAYLSMIGFIVYFLTISTAFRGYHCTGNYVIFQLGDRASIMYGFYYYGWLMATLALAMRWHGQHSGDEPEQKRTRRTITALIIGYLVFLVPTALANSVNPATRRGIPSIMCGFAVLFALILVFYILPRTAKRRS